VFERRTLRKIPGPNVREETGDWRKLFNEELHGFTFRVMKSRGMRWAGHVYAYRGLVGKPLGERRHRWEDSVKIGVKEAG
jgi:hypothetical protein